MMSGGNSESPRATCFVMVAAASDRPGTCSAKTIRRKVTTDTNYLTKCPFHPKYLLDVDNNGEIYLGAHH